MCGIVGYVGPKDAAPLLVEGLRRLEYRGYDSAGVAVAGPHGLSLLRSVGKLGVLAALLEQNPLAGGVGLGHTRWATHGKPSEVNAHPHPDCTGALAVVHNGIIENYATLKGELTAAGHVFRSETDTEVAAHLLEQRLAELSIDPSFASASPQDRLVEAMRRSLRAVRGAYALAAVWAKAPGVIVAAKSASPLVVGLGEGETFMASDVPAFLKRTRRVVFLNDGDLAALTADGARFFSLDGGEIEKTPTTIQWDSSLAEKAGYRHFMLKETHEQPRAVENTLRGRLMPLRDGILEREAGLKPADLEAVKSIHVVACGTAYHAGIVGKYLLERFARIPTQVETASEFRYRDPIIDESTLVVAISQSGETADTIAAVQLARAAGAKVLSVCNTVGSTVTRASNFNFYTHCGPECGVASTKAFIGQLVALNLFALHVSLGRGRLSDAQALAWVEELSKLPTLIEETLKLDAQVMDIAQAFSNSDHFIYIGRTLNYPTAIEGALKLKEISYIHAEGYPAGEMKHGPLALIDETMPVVAVATDSPVFEKVVSNIEEARARGGRIIALCTRGETRVKGKAAAILELPAVSEHVSPVLNIIPLQLLAYHIADIRGCDVDQPRNLAKSVTVE
jgi:glucosamine--fructose-6-phosphate aminotransferase (isomerizing)